MSTSLLYHSFGIRDHAYVRTEYREGATLFHVAPKADALRCPACRSRAVIRKGVVPRLLRALPIGHRPTWIRVPVQRVGCKSCGVIRQIELRFADPRRSYTRPFARLVLDLCQVMAMTEVARFLGVAWDVVKGILKVHLATHFARPRLKDVRRIAIDEISASKGHRYLTVVIDLDRGRVLFVGEGKGVEALKPFWRRLKASKARIEAVAIDMSSAYQRAVGENLPEATVVFDRFHVVKLFNDKLSDFRRQLYHQLPNKEQRQVLKGSRWLLLKNPGNLDSNRDEQQRLRQALELNEPLAIAYYLKEDLRRFWDQPTQSAGIGFLLDWIERAQASGIRMLERFAQTLIQHWQGLIAYFEHPISTGPLEGLNNKIKTLKRQAYGFRDMEFFKLRIQAVHQARYAFTG